MYRHRLRAAGQYDPRGSANRIAFCSWHWGAEGLLSYWHYPDRVRRARHRDLLARCEVWCSRAGDRHGVGVVAPHGDFPSWAALAYLFHPATQSARWMALSSRAEMQRLGLEHKRHRHAHGHAGVGRPETLAAPRQSGKATAEPPAPGKLGYRLLP